MISIDGSLFEGGGQILRTALALSTATQKPFQIRGIRKSRPQPGLKAQHLQCIKALEQLSVAKAENAEIGSPEIIFHPGKVEGRTLNIDIGTAGSITLLLQSLLIPSLFADKEMRIKITGGTDVRWSSPVDYFTNVFLPHMAKFGKFRFSLKSRGYYPKGNGKIDLLIRPEYKLKDFGNFDRLLDRIRQDRKRIDLIEQASLIQIKGISHASRDLIKASVAERQARRAKLILSSLGCPLNIRTEYSETLSTGSGLTLWAIFSKDKEEIDFENPIVLGADSLGEKGKKAEIVGKEAAEMLIRNISSKAAVDPFMADQLIPFIALFGGEIKASEITQHTLANAYVCEQFLGKVLEIDKENAVVKSTF